MTRRRLGFLAVVTLAGLLITGRIAAGLFVQYEWFDALAARDVWMAKIGNDLLLRAATAALAALFALGNLYAVRRSIVSVVLPRRLGDLEIGEEVPGRYLNGAVVVLSIALGLLLAIPQHGWIELALARHGVPFGETDPYFARDLGFFVYWLPLEAELYLRALWVLAAVTVVVIVLYFFFTPGLRYEKSRLTMSAHVRQHVAVLALFAFGALAWSYRLDMYGALSSGRGPLGAFSYADKAAVIPINLVLSFVTLAAGVAITITLWRNQRRPALALVTLVLIVPFIAFRVGPKLAQRFSAERDPAVRERPYLSIRAIYTSQAFGADSAHLPDTFLALASQADLAHNVSVWDPAAIVQSLARARRGATVFDNVAWHLSPAGPVATAVERLQGATQWTAISVLATVPDDRGAILRVDALGRPDQTDVTLPPALIVDGAGSDTVIADSAGVIAAPSVDGWLTRVAHAWSAQNLRLLSDDAPDRDARIVSVRDVRARLRALTPFLAQGSTIWPAVEADSLWWVVDLYAASDDYPLSQHLLIGDAEHSYFQHTATAFVHAYTGRTLLVRDRVLDPIGQTWVNAFGSLFTTWDRMPPGLAAQAPPRINAALAAAASYGRRSTELGDASAPIHALSLPNADTALAGGQNAPVACFALPAAGSPCTWSIPLLDAQERVAGLIVATGGLHPAVRRFRTARSHGRRWTDVVDRLDRAPDSASAPPGGARVIDGRIRPVPYRSGVAFVQPQFDWPANAAPTLARVKVVTDDTSGSGVTLAQALGVEPPAPRLATPPVTAAEFHARVAGLYDAMQAALKRGDLTTFGAEFNELGRLLGRSRNP